MKKILLTANIAFTIANFRTELINSIVDNGNSVKALFPHDGDIEAGLNKITVESIDYRLNRKGMNPLSDFKTLFDLYMIYKREKPDIVLNFTIKPTVYSSIACGILGIPVYSNITGLGYVFTDKRLKARIVNQIVIALYKVALRFNKKVFFQNSDDRDLFVQKRILPLSKTQIINGSGVNLQKFIIPALVKKNRNSFVFVGRLLKDKGIGELIKAMEIVKYKIPDARLYIAGGTDNNPNSFTQEDIDKWSTSGLVEYMGLVQDVRSLLLQSEVFVLPSYREGTPRSTLEAMALGLPIITTDVPGCRETVIEGGNGFLVPLKDYKKLAQRMIELALDDVKRKSMGERSLELVREKYDVHKVNQKIVGTIFEG